MWQQSNRHSPPGILLALLVGLQPCNAAEMGAIPSNQIQSQPLFQVRSETLVVETPIITGVSQSICAKPGDSVQIIGNHFPPHGTAGVALGGNSQHLDVVTKSWSTTQINIVLPLSGLQAGKRYYVGLEKPDHSRWLSNISQSVMICSDAVTGVSRSAVFQGRMQIQPRQGSSGFASSGNDAPSIPPQTEGTVPPGTMQPGGNQPFRPSGGTLIGAGLPSPPQAPAMTADIQERGIEPGELLILSADMQEALLIAQQLATSGLRPIRRQRLVGLGLVISAFRLPKDDRVAQRLQQLRDSLPTLWGEANHRYQLLGSAAGTEEPAYEQIAWRSETGCGSGLRLGMIDAAVAPDHAALVGQSVIRHSFLSAGISAAPAEHGTAIAIQLVGSNRGEYLGLLPEATLYVAEVFRATTAGRTETTAEWVIHALDWLVQQQVHVINLSLGGPRNLLLEKVLERVMATGTLVVAAAGNQGPKAPPVYPAAQQGVVAVTAIDQARRLYSQANQGDYIDFAAPGVDLRLPRLDGSPVYRSGTSFAAPFVTALLAYSQYAGEASVSGGVEALKQHAIDLGVPGKDPQFGWGLIQATGICSGR